MHYFIIPGLGGSGPDHWQTHFEQQLENCTLILQDDFDEPNCDAWINRINETIQKIDSEEIIFIAHSMGCLAVAHWSSRFQRNIKGAFLVAPADLENAPEIINHTDFLPLPNKNLPFKSYLISSTNDSWVSVEKAKEYAKTWGSEFISIGEAGHITSSSGYGKWNEGITLLNNLTNKIPT